jgi:hypothetical protein
MEWSSEIPASRTGRDDLIYRISERRCRMMSSDHAECCRDVMMTKGVVVVGSDEVEVGS